MRSSTTRPRGARGDGRHGFSLPELLVVIALLGLVLVMSLGAFQQFRHRSDAVATADTVRAFVLKARMLAVYRGRTHFVVIDPDERRVALWADTDVSGQWDEDDDTLIQWENWAFGVDLSFPGAETAMPDPLNPGGTDLVAAWSMPDPDAAHSWGTTIKGVRVGPNGRVEDASATPSIINAGTMVFADVSGQSTSVGVRGMLGNVRSFHYRDSTWHQL